MEEIKENLIQQKIP